MDSELFYYRLAAGRVIMRAVYLVAVVGILLVLVASSAGDQPPSLMVWLVFGALSVGLVVWGEAVWVHSGLEEVPEGFRDRYYLGSRILLLADVDRFVSRRDLAMPRVFAIRISDGQGVPIQGLAQGRRVVWRGGETRDIVGVLNERLALRRRDLNLVQYGTARTPAE